MPDCVLCWNNSEGQQGMSKKGVDLSINQYDVLYRGLIINE